jgi:hypothetical protein
MSGKKYKYGQEGKKIVFQDLDKRHADLRIRLRHDGLTQIDFFRSLMTGYLEGDPRIIAFITDLKMSLAKQGKRKILKTKKLIDQGETIKNMFNLNDEEKEDLFDMIAREFPDL